MHSRSSSNPREYPSARSAYSTICVLSLAYMFSYIDRQIPSLLVEPIKADFRISDTEVSLLAGFAFALFYSTTAIPISRVADRWSRKMVILSGVAFWGVMTVVCGLSRSFGQFFTARMGVGLGEAALTPSAYAMVSDLFPPERQARGMGIFVIGSSLGSGLALITGAFILGWIDSFGRIVIPGFGILKSWQVVMMGVGVATVAMLVPLAFIRDPQTRIPARASPQSGSVVKAFKRHRNAYLTLFLGVPLISMAAYGFLAWTPTYFIRIAGWSLEKTGFILGPVSIVASLAGVVGGTWLADRMRARGKEDAPLNVLIAATLVTAPVGLSLAFVKDDRFALAVFAVFSFITGPVAALGPLSLQVIVPNGMRAQFSSFFLLMANLIGLGLGPTVVALMTDYGLADESELGVSIGVVTFVGFLLSAAVLAVGRGAYRRAAETMSSTKLTT